MLTHLHQVAKKPARVVLLGAGGFIGGAIKRRIAADGIPTVALGRPELDLLATGAAKRLAEALDPNDVLVFVSAKAPCRDLQMLRENLMMAEAVCSALRQRPVAHVVYISSDAVYKDSKEPLTEASCAEPGSLHGVMHLAREVALRQEFAGPLALIRPTLVYGADDPHNGYGPNRFRRLAAAGQDIVLFGEGEELRDHVNVDDIAELVRLAIVPSEQRHRERGLGRRRVVPRTGGVRRFRVHPARRGQGQPPQRTDAAQRLSAVRQSCGARGVPRIPLRARGATAFPECMRALEPKASDDKARRRLCGNDAPRARLRNCRFRTRASGSSASTRTRRASRRSPGESFRFPSRSSPSWSPRTPSASASQPKRGQLRACDVIYVAPDVPTDDEGRSDLATDQCAARPSVRGRAKRHGRRRAVTGAPGLYPRQAIREPDPLLSGRDADLRPRRRARTPPGTLHRRLRRSGSSRCQPP